MKQAAIGFRVHSGWSAVVAVCLEKGAPVVVHRQRVHLVGTFNYRFRQPYHTAARMGIAEGREFISSVSAKARDLAYCAIRSVLEDLKERKCGLSCCALLVPVCANGAVMPISSENDRQVSLRLVDRGSLPRIATRRLPAGGGWRPRRSCATRSHNALSCFHWLRRSVA